MKPKIIFVERKPSSSVSIERVFRQIAKDLPHDEFDIEFQNVPYGNGVFAIIKNLLFFRRRPADIYHVTGDIHYISLVLPRSRTILTIHDLIFLRRRKGFRRFFLKKLFLELPLQRIRLVTAVSQATKDEINDEIVVFGNEIEVIANPLLEGMESVPEKPFDSEKPVILQVGTASNKNVATLIAALEGLSCKLKIIGRLDSDLLAALARHEIPYEVETGLDERAMVEEYRAADIVAFCSTYEGFGLPIIEAQAMGKPVITSNISPMKDVAGRGAFLSDPLEPSSIRRGLEQIISDPRFRNNLIDAGIENVKRFDGGAIAERYAEIYRHVLSETSPKL